MPEDPNIGPDPLDLAVNHMIASDWLMKESDKVTQKYFKLAKKLEKKQRNGEEITDKEIAEMDKIHDHMVELENRFFFEERQYSKIIKKLDDMDEF